MTPKLFFLSKFVGVLQIYTIEIRLKKKKKSLWVFLLYTSSILYLRTLIAVFPINELLVENVFIHVYVATCLKWWEQSKFQHKLKSTGLYGHLVTPYNANILPS